MNKHELTEAVCRSAGEKKARRITVINVEGLTVIADVFVICSAQSKAQVRAICDNVEEKLAREGVRTARVDGYQEARWVILDYGDLLLHVFCDEDREFYNLERLWNNGENTTVYAAE